MQIEKTFSFEAAHKLENQDWTEKKNRQVFGKCYNLHGHSYQLIVTVSGRVSPDTGMVLNFSELKNYVQTSIVDYLDHTYLNELPEFLKKITTAENTLEFIRNRLNASWPFMDIRLTRIVLYETRNSCAIWQI